MGYLCDVGSIPPKSGVAAIKVGSVQYISVPAIRSTEDKPKATANLVLIVSLKVALDVFVTLFSSRKER